MKIDDPTLTAFALDELDEPERSTIARAVADSPEAQRYVEETRGLARALKNEFATQLIQDETASTASRSGALQSAVCDNRQLGNQGPLTEIRDDPWFWGIGRPLAIAAVIALCGVAVAVAFFSLTHREIRRVVAAPVNLPPRAAPPTPVEAELDQLPTQRRAPTLAESQTRAGALAKSKSASAIPMKAPAKSAAPLGYAAAEARIDRYSDIRAPSGQFNTAAYDHIVENPFLDATSNPLSTFSIDVETASYSNIRRFINEGSLPPKDAVRVAEMINYFSYDYAQPTDEKPFAVHVDVAGCPWEGSHRLVRIGLKGREIAIDRRGASNLVFLLDVSGSMVPPERLPLVKQAMRLLVEKLTENDRVAIVVYAGASGLVLPSTAGDHKEQILQAIEELQAGGSTNGAAGIELAYQIAQQNFIKGGVNRVILATDGDFNVGLTSQGDLIRLIEEKAKSGVFLTVLGVGNNNLKDSTMVKLADKGNGNYAYLDSIEEARKVLVEQMNGTLVTIAKDVKVQVEFNPARVASYRLIGYEKRILRKEDFNNDRIDAGEIGAGHTVTALYEVVPVGAAANPSANVPPVDPLKYSSPTERSTSSSAEMLTVKLRYKKPDGDKSELIDRPVIDANAAFASASPDFKFAAAVAELGMVLRDSEYKGNGTLGAILEWAQEGKGSDADGYRAGFIELVRKTQALKKG